MSRSGYRHDVAHALEKAGLITRTPNGHHVWVHRSFRGTELVELYEHR
jgi:hypothetical protein